jgi:hypothetical protein
MARSTQGPIPDDYFENDRLPRKGEKTPLSKEWLDKIEKTKAERDKPGDKITGY